MLPNLRFVIGAILATSFLGAASVGLFATVRPQHQAKVGPLEASRTEAFGDRADWNQFADPDAARRFGSLTRMAEAIEIMPQPAPAEPTPAAPPVATPAAPADDDHQPENFSAPASTRAATEEKTAEAAVPVAPVPAAAVSAAPPDQPSETPPVAVAAPAPAVASAHAPRSAA